MSLRMRTVAFKLDDAGVARLKAAAAACGVPASEIIRRALDEYLRKLESRGHVARVRRVVLV